VVDTGASRRTLLKSRECVACGAAASNAHHVVQKGSPHFGDDVEANLLPLCGTGTSGCHGATHGSPYVRDGHRWTAEKVNRRIGLAVAAHPDTLSYVLDKLGQSAGREYLRRAYHLELP